MVKFLPFDSALFGYSVGRYSVENSWDEAAFLDLANDFRLVYLFSQIPLASSSKFIREVDIKLTFQKDLSSDQLAVPGIQLYTGELTVTLLGLALESGTFSRFKTDPNFSSGEFEKLYQRWIQKALASQEVLISGNLSGFVSVQVVDQTSKVGLIAVDQSQRGKGIGKRLLLAAAHRAWSLGANTLQIPTQKANLPACRLYQSLGYKVVEEVYVYHFWNPSAKPKN